MSLGRTLVSVETVSGLNAVHIVRNSRCACESKHKLVHVKDVSKSNTNATSLSDRGGPEAAQSHSHRGSRRERNLVRPSPTGPPHARESGRPSLSVAGAPRAGRAT